MPHTDRPYIWHTRSTDSLTEQKAIFTKWGREITATHWCVYFWVMFLNKEPQQTR